jgi:hypothetical protein
MTLGTGASDPASEAIAGCRSAHRVLRIITDGISSGDELFSELRDVAHDDGHDLPATPRLRAFAREVQKHIEALEGRP